MNTRVVRILSAVLILLPVAAFAQTVTLPNSAQTTTLTANVSEQATVTVPATVTFNVTNVGTSTTSANQSVSATSVVLADGKQLQISLQANAANFTAPTGGSVTWAAGDVSWNAPTWSNATGSTGTLSNSAFSTVSTCTANATACSTSTLQFTLGSKATVDRAGNHTLVVTWKFASI